MLINNKLRIEITGLQKRVRELEHELIATRMARISPSNHASRERLREAINTESPLVIVRNDDVFNLLWSHSLLQQKLNELIPVRRQ